MASCKWLLIKLILLHAVSLQAQQAPALETAAQDNNNSLVPIFSSPSAENVKIDYIGKEALSYLAYIMFAVVILIGAGLLAYLCFSGYTYPVEPVSNLKLQIPRPSRAFKTDLREVEVDSSETVASAASLGDKAPLVSHAYLAWRRSQLNISILLYVIVLVLNVMMLHRDDAFDTSVEKNAIISDNFRLRDRARVQLLDFIPLVQSIFAIFFYSASAWRWSSYSQSIRLVACGWFLVFFLPFIYFFVPWMDIVSPKEQVQGLCRFCLSNIKTVYTTLGIEMRLNGKPADVGSICSMHINEMANTVTSGLQLFEKATGKTSASQLVMTFVGLLLRYIVYFPFLLGALEALKSLAPGVLGLMLGLQKGLRMSKLMFPGVRVTSWMLIILQASALPIVMCIMALLLVVVGTIPVMATAVLITASMALFLVYADQLLKASTRAAAQVLITKLTRIAIILQIMGLGLLILGIYMADHLTALREQGVAAVKSLLDPLFIARMIMKTLAGMFVSRVLFVDVMLHIMMSTYIGVYDDPSEMRKGVFKELTSFAHLFPNYVTYKAVIPAPAAVDIELLTITSRDASTSIDINSDNEEHFLSINHGVPYHAYGQDALHDQAVCL
eukprot:TRINITY_DN108_c0_g1_i5.p1 TRINITY_DN108_c0_g1~~TRINITY_DN108_c0_g1_i5.p1  ORF type:complete len:635 (+),score=130.41 TRINITY_DN108_c0_g1_i5:64-1905(+)